MRLELNTKNIKRLDKVEREVIKIVREIKVIDLFLELDSQITRYKV